MSKVKLRLYGLLLLVITSWVAGMLIWTSVPSYPPLLEVAVQCDRAAPAWPTSAPLKVMSFNVQYMAGKGYFFYYDVENGPDRRPSVAAVASTLDRVAELIRDESPDLVLLQEINDADDSRTHHVEQLTELQQRLGAAAYPCSAAAWYWKAGLVPHPKIMGAVSMKLVTLSRYSLSAARRHQLPLMDNDFVTRHFYFQRAVLETRLDSDSDTQVAILNTHFDAWGAGSNLMAAQTATTLELLQALDAGNVAWVLGGDFNMLPPDGGRQWQRLARQYDAQTALASLYREYGAVPALEDLTGPDAARWYTHFPNNPQISAPDRTIDYIFYSPHWRLLAGRVRQHDTLDVSDHLPVIAELQLH
ncbi:MAG: endonuclease/exonuclease/phosphatase family protein [Gammaproteobacteria bacterium]|nr:endonuclease/exonuclease/phosphatase family protein [Gammaproteobacteria bacterium]